MFLKIKNYKSPGIDGISTEFLKVFWAKIKFSLEMQLTPSIKRDRCLFYLEKA